MFDFDKKKKKSVWLASYWLQWAQVHLHWVLYNILLPVTVQEKNTVQGCESRVLTYLPQLAQLDVRLQLSEANVRLEPREREEK